ncbi:MAG: hypothetical protein P1U70_21665 [Saprospiraceae bacterium]|jgi:hypothetical protein|nr:hypothetical protein [Saprospiraceae bacterium]
MKYLINFFPLILLVVLGSSCASKYHLIKPQLLELPNSPEILKNGQVKIGLRYNVLKESGNDRYAKKEKNNKVSLITVIIENNSTDTLYFPEDLFVMSQKDTLYILEMEEAYEAIRQDIVERSTGGRAFGEWLFHLPRAISNEIVQTKANQRFADELDEYYLMPCYVAPGVSMTGLLVLDAKQGTPLKFVFVE